MIEVPQPITNAQAPWEGFNFGEYSKQYGQVIWDDHCIDGLAISAIRAYDIPLGSLPNGLDAGCGAVLRGGAFLSPLINGEHGVIDLMDVSQALVNETDRALRLGRAGELGIWAGHQADMGKVHPDWSDAIFRACRLGRAIKGNVLTLPKDYYSAIIKCFCTESMTEDRQEWEEGELSFVDSARTGALVVSLAMYSSNGYDSAGEEPFPATSIEEPDVLEVIGDRLTDIQTFSVLRRASHLVRPGHTFTYRAMGGVVGIKLPSRNATVIV